MRPTVTPPFLRLRRDMRRCTAGPCSTGSGERCGTVATSRALDAATLARCVCVPTPAMPASAWRGSGRARRTASRGGRGAQANGTVRTQRGAVCARQGRTACIPDRPVAPGRRCERARRHQERITRRRGPRGSLRWGATRTSTGRRCGTGCHTSAAHGILPLRLSSCVPACRCDCLPASLLPLRVFLLSLVPGRGLFSTALFLLT